MKGDSHAAVAEVECFFDSVSVMHVDVEIQHARIHLQQLDDG